MEVPDCSRSRLVHRRAKTYVAEAYDFVGRGVGVGAGACRTAVVGNGKKRIVVEVLRIYCCLAIKPVVSHKLDSFGSADV